MKNIFLLGNFVAHIGDVKAIKFKPSTGLTDLLSTP